MDTSNPVDVMTGLGKQDTEGAAYLTCSQITLSLFLTEIVTDSKNFCRDDRGEL